MHAFQRCTGVHCGVFCFELHVGMQIHAKQRKKGALGQAHQRPAYQGLGAAVNIDMWL